MFYSVDLLNLRRRGVFSELWLAGIMTRRQFCTKFSTRYVNAIDVAALSDKVRDHLSTGTTRQRLSLVLSSKLLLGASRILNYQADAALVNGWKLWTNSNPPIVLEKKRKRRSDLTDQEIFSVPRDLPVVPNFTANTVVDVGDITIREDHFLPRDTTLGPDLLDFGTLTEEEMERMLAPDARLLDFERPVEPIQFSKPWRGPTAPLPDLPPQSPVAIPPVGEEPAVPPVDETPQTPKRKPSSPRLNGTPKRTRIPELAREEPPILLVEPPILPSVESPILPPVEPPILPTVEPPILPTVEPPIPLPVGPPSQLSLESLHSSNFREETRRRQRRRRRSIIDEETRLTSTSIESQQHTFFATTHMVIPNPKPERDLFNVPNTWLGWGRCLLPNYQEMILEEIPDQVPPEIPRGPQPKDRSSQLISDIEVSSSEGSVVESRPIVDTIPPENGGWVDLPRISEVQNGALAPGQNGHEPTLPTLLTDVPEDSDWMLPEAPLSPRSFVSRRPEPADSGSQPDSTTNGLKSDILGWLEVLWDLKGSIVHFRDLCSPEDSTKAEACQIFGSLLVLHKEKAITLMQKEPYGRIFISKFFTLGE